MRRLSRLFGRAPTATAAKRSDSLAMSHVTDLVRLMHDSDSFTPQISDMMLVADLSAQHHDTVMSRIIIECTRIDADTGRLITRGYVGHGHNYYADRQTAVDSLAAQGYKPENLHPSFFIETNWNPSSNNGRL